MEAPAMLQQHRGRSCSVSLREAGGTKVHNGVLLEDLSLVEG